MESCQNKQCVKTILEKILHIQNKSKQTSKNRCPTVCDAPLGGQALNITIPFILYCHCKPFKVEGVTTVFDHCSGKEKFVCFSTYILTIIQIKSNCAVFELLKFKHPHEPLANCGKIEATPCHQLHAENVEDLISTGVCVTMELENFTGIQCLPTIQLPHSPHCE